VMSVSAGIHVIVRTLKWMARVAGCYLFGFSTAYASGWVSTTKPDAPNAELCRALLYRLNHTSTRCTSAAIATYPEFQSPPWETLDANKYIDLIAKLLYVSVPVSPGWGKALQKNPPPDWERARALARDLVKEGDTLQIWHTRLLAYFGDTPNDPAPPESQTIALLSTKAGSRAIPGCPNSSSLRWSRTFVILPDLSGPDLRVKRGPAALLINNYPVLYKGQTLLINQRAGVFDQKTNSLSGGQVIVYPPDSGPWGGCWLEYHLHNEDSAGEN
jgi:hypothetical protein